MEVTVVLVEAVLDELDAELYPEGKYTVLRVVAVAVAVTLETIVVVRILVLRVDGSGVTVIEMTGAVLVEDAIEICDDEAEKQYGMLVEPLAEIQPQLGREAVVVAGQKDRWTVCVMMRESVE